DMVVGIPRDDTNGNNAGAAAVYSGDDGALIFEVFGETGEQLGFSVDGAGDFNDDGTPDIVVGAPKAAFGGNAKAGAARVFSGAPPHELLWSGGGEVAGDQYGYCVAGLGDVNNDGADDIIVGAPFNDDAGDDAGRAYVYHGGTGALAKRRRGKAAGDQYGRVVACGGDIDDDGDKDYVVCSPFNDQNGNNAGRVDFYAGDSHARLETVLGPGSGDKLGTSAACVGDIDEDGYGDVLLGAPNEDTNGTNAGAAYVVSGFDGSILLELFGEAEDDRFGSAVTGVQDVDGDGVPDLAVSALRHDGDPNNTGRLYVLRSNDGAVLVTIDGENGGIQFGAAIDGDDSPGNPVVAVLGTSWRFSSGGMNKRGTVSRFDLERP
ncbi:MAG: integrin alpha, partial [Planctomycetota bacterium]